MNSDDERELQAVPFLGDQKSRGKGVHIRHGSRPTPFGDLFVAITDRGVCRAAFTDFAAADDELAALRNSWPLATTEHDPAAIEPVVDAMFARVTSDAEGPLSLHVAGTDFQIAVWRALLAIPPGAVTSYSQIAAALNKPRASRAVGGAVGANPVAFLVPCHRVIRRNGALGGYRWGESRKRLMLAWEQARSV